MIAITEEPMPMPTAIKHQDLKDAVQRAETHLFLLKAQLAAMPQSMYGPIMFGKNLHRCQTCGNTSCLNFGLSPCKEKTIICNQTAMNGCLEWLPEVH